MKRRIVNWRWEDPDAQRSFADWVGFPDPEQSREELKKIEALLGLRPPLDVLDVGCGTGRHAVAMASCGYRVVAIDVAWSYLDAARKYAEENGVQVEFRLQRGSELTDESAYDFILGYDHTPGFLTDDELPRHFRKLRTALKPGGVFLMTLAGPKLIPGEQFEDENNWCEKDGKFILNEKSIRDGFRFEHSIIIDPTAGEIIEFKERQRAFSLAEMILILESSGFERIICLRDLDGSAATERKFGVFICV